MTWKDLPLAVQIGLGAIVGILLAASVAVAVLRRLRPDRDHTELASRVNSWWIMAGVFVAAILLSRSASLVLFALISYLALKEFFANTAWRRADRRPLFWAYLAIPLQYWWIADEWYGLFLVFVPVYCFLLIPMRMLVIGQTDGYLRSAATLQWGLMLTVFGLSHAAYLMVLRPAGDPEAWPGPGLLLFLVALTQLNDVAQYVWGKSLGRHKIVPKVSPGKTWEGFLGGVGTTTLLAILVGPWLTPMDVGQSACAGAMLGVLGFFGDINLSAIKRDLGVKDSGSLIPGHGGILDRVDSLTYTAPVFFHLVHWLFAWHHPSRFLGG